MTKGKRKRLETRGLRRAEKHADAARDAMRGRAQRRGYGKGIPA